MAHLQAEGNFFKWTLLLVAVTVCFKAILLFKSIQAKSSGNTIKNFDFILSVGAIKSPCSTLDYYRYTISNYYYSYFCTKELKNMFYGLEFQ